MKNMEYDDDPNEFRKKKIKKLDDILDEIKNLSYESNIGHGSLFF